MKTTDPLPALRALRLQVRALWCAALVFACVAAAANVRPLHVSNADNNPDTDVSLSSAHWTGTLDAARLPASVPLLDGSHSLEVVGNVVVDAALITHNIYAPSGDPSIDLTGTTTGVLRDDGISVLEWTYGGIRVPGTLTVDSINDISGGSILDSYGNLFSNNTFYSAGLINASGGINVNGFTSLDYGAITTDGNGALTMTGSLSSNSNLSASGGTFDTIYTFGTANFDNGAVATDGGGNLIVSNAVNAGALSTQFFASDGGTICTDGEGKMAVNQLLVNSPGGLVLFSPNGTLWRIQVSNSGVLSTISAD